MWKSFAIAAGFALWALTAGTVHSFQLRETPGLLPLVEAGSLPPVIDRLPLNPLVTALERADWRPGRHGGRLTILNRGGRDARTAVLLGYARLVGYDEKFRLRPDLLAAVEIEGDRIFTLHLRPGHKWSDGHPFTAEDFRYYWADVANDPALSPGGPPQALLADGAPPILEVLSETAVRYSWPLANPEFLPALAAANPPFIYRPAHYLKRFHQAHASPQALAEAVAAAGANGWADLHDRKDRMYRLSNPDLPTLQPWLLTNAPPTDRFIARRNPFYHRVDEAGRQLPYIDEIVLERTEASLIAARTSAGESGLQAIGLSQRDIPVLKQGEARGGYRVLTWRIGRGAQLALYPNLNAKDPVWRALNRDVRFRRALSLATDRAEINRTIFQGQAETGNNAVLPDSPLYRAADRSAWAEHDPARANTLLDSIGLAWDAAGDLRQLPDGRPLQIVVAAGDSDPAESDVLEVVAESWRKVGIELLPRASARQIFRRRIETGETVMSVFYGIANGIPDPQSSPLEWVPNSRKQPQWPAWGDYAASGGRRGELPTLSSVERLGRLYSAWRTAPSSQERRQIWQQILAIHREQVFSIGLIAGVLQPVVIDATLQNVPEQALYGWVPGAYFGAYRPDTFWFKR